MNSHKNARLTPHSRALLVQRVDRDGLRVTEAAQAEGVSPRPAYKWLARHREEGDAGLEHRPSRPHTHPKTTSEALRKQVVDLRRQRRTYRWISLELGVSVSTVGRIAKQAGINRLSALEPAPEITRYTRERAGEMIHLDIKKLARFNKPGHRVTNERRKDSIGAGWEYVHVAIDDASRISYSTIWPNGIYRDALLIALFDEHFDRITGWNGFYNHRRPHQALKMKTPALTFKLAA